MIAELSLDSLVFVFENQVSSSHEGYAGIPKTCSWCIFLFQQIGIVLLRLLETLSSEQISLFLKPSPTLMTRDTLYPVVIVLNRDDNRILSSHGIETLLPPSKQVCSRH